MGAIRVAQDTDAPDMEIVRGPTPESDCDN